MWCLVHVYENTKFKAILRWWQSINELNYNQWYLHDLHLSQQLQTAWPVHTCAVLCDIFKSPYWLFFLVMLPQPGFQIDCIFTSTHLNLKCVSHDKVLALLAWNYGYAESLHLFYRYRSLMCLYVNVCASHQYLWQPTALYGVCIYQGIISTDVSVSEERQISWLKS